MRCAVVIAVASVLCAAPEQKQGKTPAAPSEKAQSSLTGCIDQRNDRYILASEADMSKITILKGKGFSDDNFARYIGHKVTVHGAQRGDVFEVAKIVNVSDTCSR